VQFSGFADSDFDAYQDRKWASNAFNLERLQVRQKLDSLGKQLAPSMRADDGSLLACQTSAEHPAVWNQRRVACQHLFFSRNQEAQRELEQIINRSRSIASLIEDPSPLRKHVFLAVIIDQNGLMVALRLHSDATVDRENLQKRCAEYFEREKVLATLQQLPDCFELQLPGVFPAKTACEIDDEELQTIVEKLETAGDMLSIERFFHRSEPTLRQPEIVDTLSESLNSLLPALHAVTWSRSNDHLSMKATLREEDKKTKQRGLAKNDRVRIVSGMLAGKRGVVQEVTPKGEVKILIGTMSLKVQSDAVTKV
jgi:transcription antitermination factor NusG